MPRDTGRAPAGRRTTWWYAGRTAGRRAGVGRVVRVRSCRSSPPENEDRYVLVPKITDFTGGEDEPSWGQPAKGRRPPGCSGAGSPIRAGTSSRHTPFGTGPQEESDWSTRTPPAGNSQTCSSTPSRTTPLKKKTTAAKALCTRCALSDACTDYAIANASRDGIWGGLTVDERDQLTRERATAIADEN
ncbi:WhiB family transcriptional regulator [Streptomyces sp. NPDC059852]|uniref:WhiB family transcriptional regulator n=1 Tax=Streptomyces sp. NPDC059852 TaxID=3346972 RepID=UPI00364B72A2